MTQPILYTPKLLGLAPYEPQAGAAPFGIGPRAVDALIKADRRLGTLL